MAGRRIKILTAALSVGVLAVATAPSTAAPQPHLIAGAGTWNVGSVVHTLEWVGLNPQPEPPSAPFHVVVYTQGIRATLIRLSCAHFSGGARVRNFVGSGIGTNGVFYSISVSDRGFGTVLGPVDAVGVEPQAFPPNPCQETLLRPLARGEFVIV